MRILGKELKERAFKLLIDNLDDLWHLCNVIEEHDIVAGETYRRVEKAEDKLRPEKIPKKRIWLAITVERVEFHEFSNRLRVHGTIVKGPEELGLKSYHTLNFTVGSQIELGKPTEWRKHQLEQIQNAVEATAQPQVTIIAIEDDNAVIALLHQYGVRNLATINRQGTGKFYLDTTSKTGPRVSTKAMDTKKEFFNNIIMQLQQIRPENSPLIVVGPGFTKDELVKFCQEKQIPDMKDILVETTGQAGMVGVNEALRRGVVRRIVEHSRVAYETELMDKLLEGIGKDGAVVYGLAETGNAISAGAVESLLVIDKMIRGKHVEVEELMKETESTAGKVIIISSVHDAGKQLEALGGVAALLRYKI